MTAEPGCGASVREGFVCPLCGDVLEPAGDDARRCPNDGRVFPRRQGIWRFLAAEREPAREAFLDCYRAVRRDEGWGAADDAYYRALPAVAAEDPHAAVWRVRAVSYRALVARVLRPRGGDRGSLRIVDLGAGNGWLSNRLAGLGHRPAAVDLDDDARDGLGAWPRYRAPPPFVPVQASFDRLPWPPGVFDLAVFNGALHYAPDLRRALAEALRVLGAEGAIAILDSPIYRRAATGEAMLAERQADFRARYGERAAPPPGEGYLTLARMAALASDLDLRLRVIRPWYGWRWALRPLQNRLLGYRPPVRFHLLLATPRRA